MEASSASVNSFLLLLAEMHWRCCRRQAHFEERTTEPSWRGTGKGKKRLSLFFNLAGRKEEITLVYAPAAINSSVGEKAVSP